MNKVSLKGCHVIGVDFTATLAQLFSLNTHWKYLISVQRITIAHFLSNSPVMFLT